MLVVDLNLRSYDPIPARNFLQEVKGLGLKVFSYVAKSEKKDSKRRRKTFIIQ
jgi:hypothetical protein